jgi:hypothetical protein
MTATSRVGLLPSRNSCVSPSWTSTLAIRRSGARVRERDAHLISFRRLRLQHAERPVCQQQTPPTTTVAQSSRPLCHNSLGGCRRWPATPQDPPRCCRQTPSARSTLLPRTWLVHTAGRPCLTSLCAIQRQAAVRSLKLQSSAKAVDMSFEWRWFARPLLQTCRHLAASAGLAGVDNRASRISISCLLLP